MRSSSLYSSTMGVLQHHYHHNHHHHHQQHRLLSALRTVFAIFLCLLVSSTSASSSSSFSHASLPARSLFSSTRHQLGRGLAMGLTSQEKMKSSRRGNNNGESVKRVMMMNRRRVLIRMGVGSSPPTCRSRCGRCSPCKAVHVAIQPGRSVILEYYPEAWRCKCGNKLFMP
ncbi:hypothetical protein MKW98_001870 [Papaver atlanticum]|uniref:Epidermal patterning factor-like protein n=1 Tax=Papaver atlanticum TaxID=357466 RepID=A0AAD4T4J0_9MAGN|nr:hypothetical protein MKW98_001870 [Papaver atlanticum]